MLRPSLASLVLLLLASCMTPLESVYAPRDMTGWTVAARADRPGFGTITSFVPAGESAERWKQIVTVQLYENRHTPLAAQVGELESKMRARCAERTEWTILEQDRNSVLYEWSIRDCAPHEDQHELARLMRGMQGTHCISYSSKTADLDPAVRDDWLATLGAA